MLISQAQKGNSQFFLEDSLHTNFPTFLKGDTQNFIFFKKALQSNSLQTTAHHYQLYIDSIAPGNIHFFEFHLELNLNTSSQNQFRFGTIHQDSSQQFFLIGNAKDQLQYKSTYVDTMLGDERFFDKSKMAFTLQFICTQGNTTLRIFRENSTYELLFNLKHNIESPIKYFYLQINQNGKGAIGSHRISAFKYGNLPLISEKPKLLHTDKIDATNWLLSFSHPMILPPKDSIKINGENILSVNFHGALSQVLKVQCISTQSDSIHFTLSTLENRYYQILDTQFYIYSKKIPPPKYGQLRFSEIHFDKFPHYGRLPLATFLEIQKLDTQPIQLLNSVLKINQKSYPLPQLIWDKDTYLIITEDTGLYKHTPILQLGISFLVSKNTVCLYNPEGELIDSLEIQTKNQHPLYQDGGVSLETPQNGGPMSPGAIWYSNANLGGTPGKANSPMPLPAFKIIPHELIGCVIDGTLIHFEFSEILKPQQWILIGDSARQDSFYYSNTTHLALPNKNYGRKIKLQFINRYGEIRNIETLANRSGYSFTEISEIWFEAPYNADFVEIHNRGEHALKLDDLDLLLYNDKSIIQKIVPLTESNRKWFFPGEFLVITNNRLWLTQNFDSIAPFSTLEIPQFPNLPVSGGWLEIVHHQYGRIDKAPFNRTMHTQTESSDISLEKKLIGLHSAFPENWMSHVHINTKASPTFTKKIDILNLKHRWIRLENRCIYLNPPADLPLQIHFQFPTDGYYLHAHLFDSWGNPLGTIIKGLQLPQEGVFPILWDNLPKISKLGNYVIKFEARHPRSDQAFYQTERITLLNEYR